MNYETLVDLVGEALGVDTGNVSEATFEAALTAAKGVPNAEASVDAIGLALGIDTGTCHETQFEAALEAARRFFTP